MSSRNDAQTANPTEAFFSELGARGREPRLKSVSGTIRFDLTDGDSVEHWHVAMDAGNVSVSHKKSKADAIVRLDRSSFDGMVDGSVNAMAAALRGDVVPEGNLGLVFLFQRLFPSPPQHATKAADRPGTNS